MIHREGEDFQQYYDAKHFNPIKVTTKFNHDLDTLKENDMLQVLEYSDFYSTGIRKPIRLVSSKRTFRKPRDVEKPMSVSHETYEYAFERVYYSTNVYDSILVSKTIKIYQNDDQDKLYREYFFKYKNFELDYETVSYNDTIVDVNKSTVNNRKSWSKGNLSSNLFKSIDSKSSYLKVLPPIYGQLDSVIVYDGQGNIIAGKLFSYAESQTSGNPTAKRGALISDTLIGDNGVKALNRIYSYRGGYNQNFLNNVKNSLGAQQSFYYNYTDVGGYPTGTMVYNTENTSTAKIYKEFPEYETPLAFETMVRKYNSSGSLITESWKSYIEKTSYGQTGAIIDPNGFYSKFTFDNIGRMKKVWLPFDFPDANQNSLDDYDCVEFDSLRTKVYKKVDRISINYDYIDPDEWILEKDLIDQLFAGINNSHYINSNTSSTTSSIDTTASWKAEGELVYKADDDDLIQSCNNVSDIQLQLHLNGSITNQFSTIKISTDQFGFEQLYTFGANPISKHNDYSQPDELVYGEIPTLNVNLNSILDSLKNMSDGDLLTFIIEYVSFSGNVSFVTNTTDLQPCIKVNNNCGPESNDFTFMFEYNDTLRTMNSYRKVDDSEHSKHTFNGGFQKTWNDHDGRYTLMKSFHGIDDRLNKSYQYMGNPTAADRIDSLIISYDGFNKTTSMIDEIGNQWDLNYDNSFKLIESVDPNDFDMNIEYELRYKADSTGLIYDTLFNGMDYGSLMSIQRSYHDTLDIVVETYKDVFGRVFVQRTIGSDTLSTWVKYYYNSKGLLEKTVNQALDTVKYVYDDWNRLQYKFQEERGVSSFAYNEVGQVRFTQNQLQADSNKVTFLQYDDLGRTTIIGEAKINSSGLNLSEPPETGKIDTAFTRITDVLNGDVLNYTGYGSGNDAGILNANGTLFQGSAATSFWIDDIIATCMPGGEINPEDTLLQLPYLMHTQINYNSSTLSTASSTNFENVYDHPDFILKSYQYDDDPITLGKIWNAMPPNIIWDSLVGGSYNNLKGRVSAIAYRDNYKDNFHFARFSYDARGRIDKLVRYTENLGWDGVFYRYNSANQIVQVKVIDPHKQHVIWYSYDENGRVDSVWTKLDIDGSGFGISTHQYPLLDPTKPSDADLVYTYGIRDEVEEIIFTPLNLTTSYSYNNVGLLDSIVSLKDGQLFYKQVLTRNEYGLITSDSTTKDCPDMNKMQNYIYDELNRLTQWSATNESTRSFSYDRSGNRLSKQIGTTISNYNYSSDIYSSQILESIDYDDKTRTFDYNSLGSVTSVYDSVYSTQSNSLLEEFKYDLSGRVSQYIKYDDSFTPCDSNSISYSANKFVWKYRYSPFGGLESKRVYTSPTGDDCGTGHSWEYFLRGVGGSLLSHYNGRQTSKDTCGVSNRRIYFYVDSYYVPGTSMKVLADGEKIYNLSDQNGNIRAVAKEGADCARQYYDYTPFGEVITSLDPNLPAEGFGGNRTNREMDYSMMGARLYDKESGRFLSVDPLSGMFKTLTPYQYAYNSPISFSDPSGLAPIKEGSDDKIQVLSTLFSGLGLADYGSWEFSSEFSSRRRKVIDGMDSPLGPAPYHYEYDFDVNISFSYNISGGSGLSFGTSQSLSGGVSIGSGSGSGGNPENASNSRDDNKIGDGKPGDPKDFIKGKVIYDNILPVNHIYQSRNNSCFNASFEMVYDYLVPSNTSHWKDHYNKYSLADGDKYTSFTEQISILNSFGYFPTDEDNYSGDHYNTKEIQEAIIDAIDNDIPVILSYDRYDENGVKDEAGHGVVIYGYTTTDQGTWFYVYDPAYSRGFLSRAAKFFGRSEVNISHWNRTIKLENYNNNRIKIKDALILR